jgi:hypothetical protein
MAEGHCTRTVPCVCIATVALKDWWVFCTIQCCHDGLNDDTEEVLQASYSRACNASRNGLEYLVLLYPPMSLSLAPNGVPTPC